ncbi:MAG: response regulator [Elusimicrobia bacterium]|nr:response regulator [Elusimicrobiota bacterium]
MMIATATTMQPVTILLVEDNPADIRLTQEALKENKIAVNLEVATNGERALHYLTKDVPLKSKPRPDLILLDLNLPVMDGRELLGKIKEDNELKSIPVVVLTTSQANEDIVKSYKLHANCYVTKAMNLEQFQKIVKTLEDFWFTVVKLPPH